MSTSIFPPPNPPPDFTKLGCVTEGDWRSWAVFSEDRRYRYMLARVWDDHAPMMVFGMQNPSSAGAAEDDPTIRKCLGFGKRYKCGGIIVVNGAARIATNPRDLLAMVKRGEDIVGEHNDVMIRTAFRGPLLAIGVGAWGAMSRTLSRKMMHSFTAMRCARKLWCFGKTKDGEPRHPLMLSYETPLVSMTDGRPWI
jgi:hypothetical protein